MSTKPLLDEAKDIRPDASQFSKNLSPVDTDVQKALETLDALPNQSDHDLRYLKLAAPNQTVNQKPTFVAGIQTGIIDGDTLYDRSQVIVSGAGTTAANGTYTFYAEDAISETWKKDADEYVIRSKINGQATIEKWGVEEGTEYQLVYYYISYLSFTGTENDFWDVGPFGANPKPDSVLYPSTTSIQFPFLTSNGFLKTGSSNGTLSVDTNNYALATSVPRFTYFV
jgi:hypothetical protein